MYSTDIIQKQIADDEEFAFGIAEEELAFIEGADDDEAFAFEVAMQQLLTEDAGEKVEAGEAHYAPNKPCTEDDEAVARALAEEFARQDEQIASDNKIAQSLANTQSKTPSMQKKPKQVCRDEVQEIIDKFLPPGEYDHIWNIGKGNCLFLSFAEVLKKRGIIKHHLTLRREVAEYLQTRQDWAFNSGKEEHAWRAFCKDMATPGVWAGDEAIAAAAQIYKLPILVLSDRPKDDSYFIWEHNPENYTGGIEPIRIFYMNGNHYEAVLPRS